jgi:hypothetical protein
MEADAVESAGELVRNADGEWALVVPPLPEPPAGPASLVIGGAAGWLDRGGPRYVMREVSPQAVRLLERERVASLTVVEVGDGGEVARRYAASVKVVRRRGGRGAR